MNQQQTAFANANVATGGFLADLKEMLEKPLSECVQDFQKEGATPIKMYEAAEAMRVIFAYAYQANHRLNAVANSLRIEEVG